MQKPVEIRVRLRKSLQETLDSAGKAIRKAIGKKAVLRAYGPRWAYDENGEKAVAIYRVDLWDLDVAQVFIKDATTMEA